MDVDESDDDCRPIKLSGLDEPGDEVTHRAPKNEREEAARARAQVLFSVDPSQDDDDELLVVQLPTYLPEALPRRKRVKAEADADAAADAVADAAADAAAAAEPPAGGDEAAFTDVAQLAPGKIGKLQIMASGEVRLVLGGETFDVDRGVKAAMYQQLCAIDAGRGDLVVLGDVGKKLLCTVRPDDPLPL